MFSTIQCKSSFILPISYKKINNNAKTNFQSNLKKEPVSYKHYMYLYPSISFRGKIDTYDTEKIRTLGITNLHCTNENGVRGESLSHRRNKKYISSVKDCGIKQIIDLKTTDHSSGFANIVKSYGMKYSHFPIDSEKTTDKQIIGYLGELFRAINEGDFYIACAQGLHRTDIALSLNYFFNKDADEEPPILYGHQSKDGVRYGDILRRTNSVFKTLTPEDKEKLGISHLDEKEYKRKKEKLMAVNNSYNQSNYKD